MRHRWFRVALLAGITYFVIGRLFAWPTSYVQMWRLAAWVASAVLYTMHVWYEYFRTGSSSRSTALHVAVAVAIGAFLLAVAGMLHAVTSASGMRATWLLALVVWPAVTAVPALCLGIVAVGLFEWFWPRSRRAG